jgi:hypothetical protein
MIYEPTAGTSIEQAAKTAIRLAYWLNEAVTFEFNGIKISVQGK